MSVLPGKENPCLMAADALRLEGVTVSVGFDDVLDVALGVNHAHFDTMIVVTSHADKRTQAVGRKHSAIVVLTDLFTKNGRHFNKGAAINAGFNYWQYHGWRLHLDADILLPDNFRRVLFNHTTLDRSTIYGADRVDLLGDGELTSYLRTRHDSPQHKGGMFLWPPERGISHRWMSTLEGYLPLGYFQLWHASCQKPYPYSLGTAAHDDLMFSALWPRDRRVHLPTVLVRHLCGARPRIGENWDGQRRQPRLNGNHRKG